MSVSVAEEAIPFHFFLFFFISASLRGDFLLGDNQWEQALPLGWGQWVLWGADEWLNKDAKGFPILLPTPIFLSGDGNTKIDSWAFPSNSLDEAVPVPGTSWGHTTTHIYAGHEQCRKNVAKKLEGIVSTTVCFPIANDWLTITLSLCVHKLNIF